MKNYAIVLFFMAFSFNAFSQPAFTEKTMQDIKQRILADYPKYLKEDLSADFTFIVGEGQTYKASDLQGLTEAKILEWSISELKLKQFGNIAIATGVNKHSMVFSKGGTPQLYNVAFTYTYEYKNNKWLWTHVQHTYIQEKEDKPEEIVKQWVSEYNKDNRAFFMDKCTDDFIASNSGGKFFGKKVLEGIKEGQTTDAEVSDMKAFQSGNLAVVTGIMTYHHKQADGSDKPDKNIFTFTMVKNNGKWLYAAHHASSMKE